MGRKPGGFTLLAGNLYWIICYCQGDHILIFNLCSFKTVAEGSGDIDDSLIGGNKSAEEPSAEEYNADTTYGVNIVFNHRLQAAPTLSYKDFTKLFKGYVKKVHEYLKDNGQADEAECFKSGIGDVLKKLKAMWDDLVLYTGESASEEGMYCFLNYRDNGDPYMIFFKHGLKEEKFVSFSSYYNCMMCDIKAI
jgi:hypothetical protein